jgi:hypothetical protein
MKLVTTAVLLASISTGAWASRARMAALNQGTDLTTRTGVGSYYLKDNRNIWRSAAALNDLGSHMTFEFGADAINGVGGTAEAGYFQQMGEMTLGLQLNNHNYGAVASNAGVDPGRADIFYAKGNLGVRLGYEKLLMEGVDTEGTGIDFGVGYNMGNTGFWVNYVPSITNQIGGVDTDSEASMNLGVTHQLENLDLFGEYKKLNDDDSTIVLGAARVHQMDDGMMFFDLTLNQSDISDASSTDLSLAFGSEIKANSWLTWRASLRQDIYQANDGDQSTRNTSLGMGASLTLGEMVVDGTIINQSTGRLGSDEFLSNVSMTYAW